MDMIRVVIIVLLLAGCASNNGKPVPMDLPQAKEQCKAQPWLDWCHEGK